MAKNLTDNWQIAEILTDNWHLYTPIQTLGLGYMTVSEILETVYENDLFDMFPEFSNVAHILAVHYLLHRVLQNDHSVRCADWKLTSSAPWGNNVSVTSHLSTL